MIGLAVTELPKRIGRVLSCQVGDSELISPRSSKALIEGVKLGLLAHTCFVALFIYIEAYSMARFNVLSLLTFAVCLGLSRQPKNLLVVLLLFAMEVIAHAVVAVGAFGWDSGYHYYLFIFVPFIFANDGGTFLVRFVLVGVLCVAYMLIHFSAQGAQATVQVSADILNFMFYSNVIGVFTAIAYLADLHRQQVMEVEVELKKIANTDVLTGLKNRRHLLELVEVEMNRRKGCKKNLSLAVMDIDDFKIINDKYGHDVGDAALVQVANLITESVRQQDYVARWGGEEFLLLLPETDQIGASKLADFIRCQISSRSIAANNESINLSVSIGISEFSADEAFDSAFARADDALYQAKGSGKNKVVISDL